MRQNVPPAHFGYMASGIDDEVTLRRNREDFLKFQLRPRRLVDVSKVDMSVDILGTKYDSPIVLAPVGGQRSFHDDGEVRRRPCRQGRQSPADHVHHDLLRRSRRWPRRAARRSGCSFTPPTARASRKPSSSAPRTPAAPASPITVDRSGGRNQETLFRLRPSDTRDCNGCHDRTSLQTNLKGRAMFQGVDLTGLRNTQSSNLNWDRFKRIRDAHQDEGAAQGHPRLGGRGDGGRCRPRRHHRVEPRRALGGFRPLDHRRAAGDRRGGEGPHADPGRLRASAAAPTSSRRCAWGRPRSASAGPISGGSARSAKPASNARWSFSAIETYAMIQQMGAQNVKQLVPAMVRRA